MDNEVQFEEEKSPSVYIREKVFSKPRPGPEDRSFVRFQNETPVSSVTDFNQLYFKVAAPTSQAVLKNIFVVLPLRFRFRNRKGELVSDRPIALKADGLDRIFRSIRVSMNGTFFNSIPFERLHHEWCTPSLSYFKKSDGCLLPVRAAPDVKLPGKNAGWEERCAFFAQHKGDFSEGTYDAVNHVIGDDFGDHFDIDLKIQLDSGILTNYMRSQHENVNSSIPYAYEMDITLLYNNTRNASDASDLVKSQGQPCWSSIFEIEQPISKLPLDRVGYKSSEYRYLREVGVDSKSGFLPQQMEHVGIGYQRKGNAGGAAANQLSGNNADTYAAIKLWFDKDSPERVSGKIVHTCPDCGYVF